MIRRIMLLASLMILTSQVHASQVHASWRYCASEAARIAHANGGEKVKLYRSDVTGWGVNTDGSISYTYTRGNQECYVAFDVYGTYFYGTQCRESYGFIMGDGSPNCGKIGSWTSHPQ